MAKELGFVSVIASDAYNRKDGSVGYRITALTEEGQACVFYRDSSEGEPKQKDRYQMVLGFDNTLKPVVRFQRA